MKIIFSSPLTLLEDGNIITDQLDLSMMHNVKFKGHSILDNLSNNFRLNHNLEAITEGEIFLSYQSEMESLYLTTVLDIGRDVTDEDANILAKNILDQFNYLVGPKFSDYLEEITSNKFNLPVKEINYQNFV